MKISHEVPLQLLKESLKFNDYDYALVHLFNDNKDYYNYYKDSLDKGRMVILDNSLYELGDSYNSTLYKKWIIKLKPTYYILPDTFSDCKDTLNKVHQWFRETDINSNYKCIGVVHGRTLEDIVKCYCEYLIMNVDKIAFNFADEVYKTFSRSYVIEYLLNKKILDTNKEHHLLGALYPFEFSYYTYKKYDFITTIDTSHPIMYGYDNGKYFFNGNILEKPLTKVNDIFNENISNDILEDMYFNINLFRTMCNG